MLEKLFFIEVKTLHIPREEENRLMSPYLLTCEPDFNHKKGLEDKINYYIKDASTKFNDIKAENKILMIYSTIGGLADISYISKGDKSRKLDDILDGNFFKDEESKYNMKIIIFDLEN